jgi:DnaK suppressor protein
MAKAKKTAKAKKAKKVIKKIAAKKVKNTVVKKSNKKPIPNKKTANKKAVIAKKTMKKKEIKKVEKKAKVLSKKAEKTSKNQEMKTVAPVKQESAMKAEKEKKKTKEEIAEEKEMLGEETYLWDSGTFSDMKNYEPTPVFRKPDPPQPKFKGKIDTRTRYSDKELGEFRDIINEKIGESEKDYELLKNTLAHKDEHGTDDTSPTFKVLEDGSDAMSREEIAQLASRQEKHIQNLKNALIRIENKTYGICRVTGKLIPKERLRSVPHATLSIEAKLIQNS